MNYKYVVTRENKGKVYRCKDKSGSIINLQVWDVGEIGLTECCMWDYDNSFNFRQYFEDDVDIIYYELQLDEDDCELEDEGDLDFLSISKYKVQSSVYAYENLEQLDEILKALRNPRVDTNAYDYRTELTPFYGLVYYYSEYDDFSCGDGFTHWVKIINGARIV